MNKTNGMQVVIKNGTMFLNDDITIEFSEATLSLPESIVKGRIEEIKPVILIPAEKKQTKKANKKSKQKTEPVKKEKVKPQSPTISFVNDSVFDSKLIIEYLQQNGPTKLGIMLIHFQKSFPGITQPRLNNACWSLKKKGILETGDAFGIYKISENANIKKENKPVIKKQETIVPSVEKTEYKKYITGDDIIPGDEIKILSEDSKTEDDILEFPEEYSDRFAIIVKSEEGSNFITVRINRENKELLVYPHWIKLSQRKK